MVRWRILPARPSFFAISIGSSVRKTEHCVNLAPIGTSWKGVSSSDMKATNLSLVANDSGMTVCFVEESYASASRYHRPSPRLCP